MEIFPGVGVGGIKFGMSEANIVEAFGKPDRVDEEEHIEGRGDWHRVLWYSYRNIHFTFDADDDYKLGTITIMGPGYRLHNKELFGAPMHAVKNHLVKCSNEIPVFEDHSWDEDEPHECLIHDALGMMFWFDCGYLTEIQCGYLFESDNETPVWP